MALPIVAGTMVYDRLAKRVKAEGFPPHPENHRRLREDLYATKPGEVHR